VKAVRESTNLDPGRRPDWRWRRVLHLIDAPRPRRCSVHDDDCYIRKAREIALRLENANDLDIRDMEFSEPGALMAIRIHQNRKRNRRIIGCLQARLLAGQPFEEIANLLSMPPSAVEWYEALFFHVKDYLMHRDWIINAVLMPPLKRFMKKLRSGASTLAGPLEEDPSVFCWAYFGGPGVVDAVLHGVLHDMPSTTEKLNARFGRQFAFSVRHRALQAIFHYEINERTLKPLLTLNQHLMALAKKATTGRLPLRGRGQIRAPGHVEHRTQSISHRETARCRLARRASR